MKEALSNSWNSRRVMIGLLTAIGCFTVQPQRAESATDTTVARIIDCQMPVSVHGAKVSAPAAGLELHGRDTVIVSLGGSVTLAFQDGVVQKYDGSAVITMTVKDKPKEGLIVKLASGLVNAIFPGKAESEKARLAVRSLTFAQPPSLTVPMLSYPPSGTVLMDTPDRLEWLPIEGATQYLVSLYDQERIVWQERTQSSKLRFPGDTVHLRPGGSYVWTVQTELGNTTLRSEQSFFGLIDTIGRNQIARALAEIDGSGLQPRLAALLRTSLYGNHNLLVEASHEVEVLLKQTPDDFTLLLAKAKLCEAMSMYQEAATCYHRALEQ
jgi:hypothetical protein